MIGIAGSCARIALETAIAESQLRPAHDGDAHRVDSRLPSTRAASRGDEIAIDVAVDDRRVRTGPRAPRTDSAPQGKSRAAPRGDRRVDEQDARAVSLMTASAPARASASTASRPASGSCPCCSDSARAAAGAACRGDTRFQASSWKNLKRSMSSEFLRRHPRARARRPRNRIATRPRGSRGSRKPRATASITSSLPGIGLEVVDRRQEVRAHRAQFLGAHRASPGCSQSLSSGKPTMNGKVAGDAVTGASFRRSRTPARS